uniref:Uncharacterized protein n=2 Tax=Heterosigma akashiwo TaxID=2829 RepID=A0A7S3XT35_HETAK|mmetsp:Transcript_31319/g.54259  ORF Transcript_31319/g.54259 Transcript_31319/m.54259 type:complete len:123 (-) Transcript_31319:169-537(-)
MQLKKDGGHYDQGTNMTQQHNKSGGTNATERTATTSAKRYSKTRNTINTRTSNKEQASHRRKESESSSQPLSASTRAANFFEMNDPRRQEYISIFKAAGDLDDDKEGCGDGDQDGHDMEGRG